MRAMVPTATRRRLRELIGWTILTSVLFTSKLAVWLDGLVTGNHD